MGLMSSQLETDPSLLIPKARQALARYGHQVVIGNELHTRKYQVVFVSPARSGDEYTETWVRIDPAVDANKEIEEEIVAELAHRHRAWIDSIQS